MTGNIYVPVTGNFFLQYKSRSCDTKFLTKTVNFFIPVHFFFLFPFFSNTGKFFVTRCSNFAMVLCEAPIFRGIQDPHENPTLCYCTSLHCILFHELHNTANKLLAIFKPDWLVAFSFGYWLILNSFNSFFAQFFWLE